MGEAITFICILGLSVLLPVLPFSIYYDLKKSRKRRLKESK